jgi:hypothetical protein
MVQSWGVSRFNGHISSLGATIERAEAQLACAAASIAISEAAFMPAPPATGRLDHIAIMRALVAATAVAALALLILILL